MRRTNLLFYAAVLWMGLLMGTSCSSYLTDREYSGMVDGAISADQSGQADSIHAGVVTAGEWNDLNHWSFWQGLMSPNDTNNCKALTDNWGFYTMGRVGIQLQSNQPTNLSNVDIQLKLGDETIWTTRSDRKGRAELWINLYQKDAKVADMTDYTLFVNQQPVQASLCLDSVNVVALPKELDNKTTGISQIAFMVDATGSMSDELEFLKKDLKDVIARAAADNAHTQLHTAAVFYRDEGDDYVTRRSDFESDFSKTQQFISKQQAQGGGDYPEAVHTAMAEVLKLQWSNQADAKVVFLLLDAPPHNDKQIVDQVHQHVRAFAARGIKLVPVASSGIDKSTEFLLRYFAITTCGTYVFLTDHSGVGNPHLSPTIGDYQVEKLNDLLVRLINEYCR